MYGLGYAMQILIDHGCGNNIGDIAMMEAVIMQYLSVFPATRICVAGHPPLPAYLWDEERVLATNTYALDPNAFDMLHVAGGGNLTDIFPVEVRRRCALINAFLAQHKVVILSGQQLGPFHDVDLEKMLMHTLRDVSYIGVRDEQSLELCKQYGIPPDRFSLTGDDSLGITPGPKEKIAALLDPYRLQPGKFLALNMRLGSYVPEHDEHMETVARLYDAVAEQLGLPVLYVPISLNTIDSDTATAATLATRMRHPFRILDTAHCTPSEMKGILGNTQSCVGYSWHFCTFALSQGIPAVCIHASDYYAQKGNGLCAFWGDGGLAVSMHMPFADLLTHICHTLNDTSLPNHLLRRSAYAHDVWTTFFREKIPLLVQRN